MYKMDIEKINLVNEHIKTLFKHNVYENLLTLFKNSIYGLKLGQPFKPDLILYDFKLYNEFEKGDEEKKLSIGWKHIDNVKLDLTDNKIKSMPYKANDCNEEEFYIMNENEIITQKIKLVEYEDDYKFSLCKDIVLFNLNNINLNTINLTQNNDNDIVEQVESNNNTLNENEIDLIKYNGDDINKIITLYNNSISYFRLPFIKTIITTTNGVKNMGMKM